MFVVLWKYEGDKEFLVDSVVFKTKKSAQFRVKALRLLGYEACVYRLTY